MNRHQLQTFKLEYIKRKSLFIPFYYCKESLGALVTLWSERQERRNLFLSYWQKSFLFC